MSKAGVVSKAHAVAQHLPYLRRYARALTGSQASGDAYVAAALEALVKEPELLEIEDLPRVALFRLFSAIWNSLACSRCSVTLLKSTVNSALSPGSMVPIFVPVEPTPTSLLPES